jgi:hypothetical protein
MLSIFLAISIRGVGLGPEKVPQKFRDGHRIQHYRIPHHAVKSSGVSRAGVSRCFHIVELQNFLSEIPSIFHTLTKLSASSMCVSLTLII